LEDPIVQDFCKQGSAPARSPMTGGGGGLLGGMDIGTVSALIVLASAFMRR